MVPFAGCAMGRLSVMPLLLCPLLPSWLLIEADDFGSVGLGQEGASV